MAKKFSRQLNNQVSDGGHKTHTTALVLMVLFTGLVLTIALGDGGSFGQAEGEDAAATATEEVTQQSESVGSEQVAAAADPLSNIPVDPDVKVARELVTRGDQAVEQTITYETSRSNGELTQAYRDWLATSGYITQKEKVGNYAASLAATNGDSAIVVLISYLSAEDMSRVEIINYPR